MALPPDNWPVFLFTGTAVLSFCLVGLVTAFARRSGILALPGPRQSHLVPTPTGGGAGLVAALVLAGCWPLLNPGFPGVWTLAVLPGLSLLAVIGWIDDRRGLGVTMRLLVQLAVSCWLLAFVHPGWPLGWPFVALMVASLFFTMGLMNAWNFMDGSNGMAAGQGLFCSLVLAGLFALARQPELAAPALALAAACAGFLPWNLPRARVFMGDAGSVPLGFAVAALLLVGCRTQALSPAVALLLPAVFGVDAGLTLARRILKGERWYTAHKQHVYQRLTVSGWSHNRVLALYQAINLFVVLPGVVLATRFSGAAWLITGILILAMIVTWMFTSLKLGERT